MNTLDVVNECLATMGHRSLNSLSDPHPSKGEALARLNKVNEQIQAIGWWFNEEILNLSPAVNDNFVYVPNDVISLQTPKAEYVQRGNRLYNRTTGSFTFTESVKCVIRRLVPYADLPLVAAQHIGALTVLEFQSDFDADPQKRQELQDRISGNGIRHGTLALLNAEEIRQQRVNMITGNARLQRLKQVTRQARGLLS